MPSQKTDNLGAEFQTGSTIQGYEVKQVFDLPQIQARAVVLVHRQTGARHLHLAAPDKENAFGVTFKTVPTDSSGVAHILEHTVLCGSRRYPVRDPFFSMLKRSLSTFMNAFTASDWTMYPFCTQNKKDYYNLLDVYLDAAFFPRLDELSFKQEGHRLEIVPAADGGNFQLQFKGVVYNEMKGAMSSADQVMARSLLNALYPDTTYRFNSGGDPAVIPDLTYQQLKDFHRRHYHPSNAYFYTYGDFDLGRHLEFIRSKVLDHFEKIDPGTGVTAQPRWNSPRQARYTYPIAPDQDPGRKSQACLAWLVADIRDTFEILVLAVIEQVLLGNPASPLRKALLDSGLGSSLSDHTGFDADNRDTMFTCGLKDVAEEDAPAVEKIIFNTLERLVDQGVPGDLVEAAIHQIEFGRKEITNTPYPYGMKLLLGVIGTWLHGGDPAGVLRLEDLFVRLRKEQADGGFIEQRIRRYFLENNHRVCFVLAPDPQKAAAELGREARRLARIKSGLTEEQLARIKVDADRLAQLQESSEDISCLPSLELEDIPPAVVKVAPMDRGKDGSGWRYVQPTSGIFYMAAAAGLDAVNPDLLELIPFLAYIFTKVGTSKDDYVTLARRLDATVGGLSLTPAARSDYRGKADCRPLVMLTVKCLERNLEQALELVSEIVSGIVFTDHNRLRQLLLEYRAGLESMVVHNGHRLAISLASRNLAPAAWLDEIWSGIHQLQFVKRLGGKLDKAGLESLAGGLETLADQVFRPSSVAMALIGGQKAVGTASGWINNDPVLGAFQKGRTDLALPRLPMKSAAVTVREGWSTATAVAFVAQSLPTITMGHPHAPVLAALAKILRSAYLHREIREKGGAYGGFAIYNPETGIFSLGSYRDPQIARTLSVYRQVGRFLSSGALTDRDVKEAILQVCSDIDRPDPPAIEARKAFLRDLLGLDDARREAFKSKLLTLSLDEILAVAAEYLQRPAAEPAVAVIAGKEQLEAANRQLEPPLVINSI